MDGQDWLERIREGIASGKYPAPVDSPQPELNDTYSPAPESLTPFIRSVAVDPAKCVRWFETDRGPVWRFAIPGRSAPSCWQTLRAATEKSGHWPLILGANQSIEYQNSALQYENKWSLAEILQRAETVNVKSWKEDRYKEFAGIEEPRDHLHGPWPDDAELQTEFDSHLRTFDRNPHDQVWLGLVPTQDSCDVPAIFKFGDWNEVPEPAAHVAQHREWRDRFGAEIACLRFDVIEMLVARPSSTPEVALQLAQEQYEYCADIVDQGVGTIEALAATLLNGRIWYFWWD